MTVIDHIPGHTWHGRKGAVDNAFRYGIDYVLVDAEARLETPALFGRNRSGLASLWDSDHGGPPGAGRGPAWVREVLAAHDLPRPDRIELLAQPRVLGHVFNPVAFWICRDARDNVRAIIAEVSNTYGDRHSYLCHLKDFAPITANDKIEAQKIFHVSPFQEIAGQYQFTFDVSQDRIAIRIAHFNEGEGLIATLTGARAPMSNARLLAAMMRRPFGPLRTIALIYWQAFRLKLKGAPYRQRPIPPEQEVSQ